jgi:glycosyltransferase involved in cell wall biosynthesis
LSKFEGVPTVLFEARFYGLIPIFSDAGASKDYILDGVDGFILDQGSFQMLPEILDKLKKDDLDRLSLQSYRAFKNNYYEHEMTSAFLKLYQRYFEYDKN